MTNNATKTICFLPGDGIGPEVMESATAVLKRVAQLAGYALDLRQAAIGGEALDSFGTPIPDETVRACQSTVGIGCA